MRSPKAPANRLRYVECPTEAFAVLRDERGEEDLVMRGLRASIRSVRDLRDFRQPGRGARRRGRAAPASLPPKPNHRRKGETP